MAYDEFLAERVRRMIGSSCGGISEKKMFGGLAFLLSWQHGMRHRWRKTDVAPGRGRGRGGDAGAAREADGLHWQPIRTMIFVEAEGLEGDAELACWVGKALVFARALPKK